MNYEPLSKHSIYTLKSNQWIKIWSAKFELECLVTFINTPIQNSKSLAKTGTLNLGRPTSELTQKKKRHNVKVMTEMSN